MDSGDPTNLLLTKLRSVEPGYAPKIIGYLLLQDFTERDLMRLALGPDSVLQSLISKVKTQLGILSSNTSLNPISRPPINGRSSHSNGFVDFRRKSPSSTSPTSPWTVTPNNGTHISPKHTPLVSMSPHQDNGTDLLDDQQLSDYLSFLDDSCSNTEDVVDNGETHLLHRRSFSADASFVGSGDDGFGKPCMYFSRGLCKNGESCKFVHGGFPENGDGNGIVADSPRKMEGLVRQHEEMLRMKMAFQQQRLASQVLGRAPPPLSYEKRMDFLLHQHAQR